MTVCASPGAQVPKGYEPNKKLGTWTARQRKDYVKIVKARDGGKVRTANL